jgi:cardiolipin synthase
MRLTTATKITLLRFLLVPFLIFFILNGEFKLSFVIFSIAALTDGLDGFVARKFNQRSPLGAILDPASDKILMLSAFITLSLTEISPNRVPKWLVLSIFTRDFIIVSGVIFLRFFYNVKTFSPSIWGKMTTGAEALTGILVLLGNAISRAIPFISSLYYLTFFLVLISGFDYSLKGLLLIKNKNQ